MKIIVRTLLQLVAVVLVSAAGGQALAAVQGRPWLMLAAGVGTAVVAIFVYKGLVRLTERRRVVEAGRAGLIPGLLLGTALGMVVFGAVIANIFFLGYYQVHGIAADTGIAGLFGFMAAASVTEELMFRGVLFRVLEPGVGSWLAMLITAVLFGAFHLVNPDATLWGAAAIAIEAGGMLTAAYIATRKLWVPIGLHFGWNFAQSAIFSSSVSGNGANQGLLEATMNGPALITGGAFGPEGSVYAVICCALTAIVFMIIAGRRGRLMPLRTRAARTTGPATTDDVATLSR